MITFTYHLHASIFFIHSFVHSKLLPLLSHQIPLKVINDLTVKKSCGHFLVLVFIVLSAAFTLGPSFFLKYSMLLIFMSHTLNFYLTYLTTSSFSPIDCSFSTRTSNVRIPQSSSLQLKTTYVTLYSPLGKLIEAHCFNYHVYVDDSISVFLTFHLLIYPTTPLTLLLNILT